MCVGIWLFVKYFGYHKWELVRTVINGLDRVDVTHLIQLRKIAFNIGESLSIWKIRFYVDCAVYF